MDSADCYQLPDGYRYGSGSQCLCEVMKYANNPLNIRYNPHNRWKGQVEPRNGFCQFESMEMGVRAATRLIICYMNRYRLHSPREIITRWAPPEENDTEQYIRTVCRLSGLGGNERIAETDETRLSKLVRAMAVVETGTVL